MYSLSCVQPLNIDLNFLFPPYKTSVWSHLKMYSNLIYFSYSYPVFFSFKKHATIGFVNTEKLLSHVL